MSQLKLAMALAGPEASIEEVALQLYALKKHEHRVWFGDTRPFPAFEQWIEEITRDASEVSA